MRVPRTSRGLPAVLIALLAGAAGCGDHGRPEGLILVTIDTCRADRIGAYGSRTCETPAIDDLAERGVLFGQVSAPVPLTLPSHCSILTGLYPDRHTLRDNGAGRLPDEAQTFAEVLSARGWRTAAFVSAVPVSAQFGADQGFALYDDRFTGSAAGPAAATDEQRVMADRLFFEERIASQTADAALPWLQEAAGGDRPFFAWIHFFDPHAVYRPPPAQAARYGPGSYDGEVAFVDEQIGRILEAMGEARDRITVVVTADHGESLGDHGEQSHGLFVYESTLHVPWVMAGPALPAGVRVETPVSLVDLLPTVLEGIGETAPAGLDGVSRMPVVRGEAGQPSPVFGECLLPRIHYDWAGLRSVRLGKWKLIDAPRRELYDLEADPQETTNVADAHEDVVSRLVAALDEHDARGGTLTAEAVEVDPLVREQLDRLGYVGSGTSGAEPAEDPWNRAGRDPKDMVGFFNRFQEVPTLLLEGRTDEAAQVLTELRAEDPGNVQVLERLAMVRRTEERWEDVRDLCREILEHDPGDVRMRRNLAYALLRLDDTEGALREYREAAATRPDDAETWALLGELLSREGRHREAIETLERAVALAPEDAETRAALARAREDSGDATQALADYDRALALDDSLPQAVNGKALLLSHTGRKTEAVRVLRDALPRVGDDVDVLNNLAWILTDESIDPEEGYLLARRAAALSPDDPAVLDTLGWSAVRSGRAAEAVAPLTKAWEATRDAEVRAHLGVALAESGRVDEGRAHVRAAVAERADLTGTPEIATWR